MKITIEDLKLEDLEWDYDYGDSFKSLLRKAIEDECRKAARQVAEEAFLPLKAEVVDQMKAWLAENPE